jgi:hypothetical protein
MADDTFDYSDYQQQGPGDNALAELSHLAMQQQQAEAEVARLEEELRKAQNHLKDLAERQIPEMMDNCGMSEFTTRDGIKIKVDEKIRGSIPKNKEPAALQWLEDNGHGNLIKRQFVVEFNKDEEKLAKKFKADLEKRKSVPKNQIKRTVHATTLQSFVKEQLEKGVDFPLETFGVFRQRFTKIQVK